MLRPAAERIISLSLVVTYGPLRHTFKRYGVYRIRLMSHEEILRKRGVKPSILIDCWIRGEDFFPTQISVFPNRQCDDLFPE